MPSSDEYSRKAGICFAFAEYTNDPKLRAELYALAKLWVSLAEQAGRNSRNLVVTPRKEEEHRDG